MDIDNIVSENFENKEKGEKEEIEDKGIIEEDLNIGVEKMDIYDNEDNDLDKVVEKNYKSYFKDFEVED